MTAFNISGIVSGIDTSSLISQLMTAAAAPQTALQNQVTTDQGQITAYQGVNTNLAAVSTAAQTLAKSDTWNAATATSSDSSIVATASTSAQPGTYTSFSVTKVATAQVTTVAASGATIADPSAGIDVVASDGTDHHIDLTDGSAAGVAAAVNNAGLGVRAAVVSTDSGPVLQLTGTSTGAASAFTVNGLSGTPQNLVSAQDAQITVGDPDAGGYTISSPTNTFSSAIPGVTFTVSKPVTSATITVSPNESSMSSNVQALITAANTALTTIGTDTAQNGVLSSDTTLTSIQQSLLSVVSAGTSTGGSLSTYGISINSSGQLTFDPDAFASAYASDPTGTQTAVSAFATSMNTVSTAASDPTNGSVTQLINSQNSQVTSLNSQIADWTTRLADEQSALEAKYTAMETALATLKNESNYLNSLFGNSSSSSSSSSSGSSSSSNSSSTG